MMPHHLIPVTPGHPTRVHLDRARRRHLLRRHRTHRTRKARWHYLKNINQTVRAQPRRNRPVLLPLLQPSKGHLQTWQRHQDRFMVLEKDHLGQVRGSKSVMSCRANKCLINATPTASLKAAKAHSLQNNRAYSQPSRPKLRSHLQRNQVRHTAVPPLLALERRCKRCTTSIGLVGRQREQQLLSENASLVS